MVWLKMLPGNSRLVVKYGIDLVLWGLAAPLAFWLRLDNRWLSDASIVIFDLPITSNHTVAYSTRPMVRVCRPSLITLAGR
jgi:hypothetical protein